MACIYCGSDGESDEHLIPQSLGGRLIARFVCESCNKSLSAVDQAFAERSFTAIARMLETPVKVQRVRVGGTHFLAWPEINSHVDVRIGNGSAFEIYPQIHLGQKTDGRAFLFKIDQPGAALTLAHLVVYIEQNLHNSFSRIHRKIQPESDLPTPRLVLEHDKSKGRYRGYIRARSGEDADELCKALQTNWQRVKETILNPDLAPVVDKTKRANVNVPIDDGQAFRGIAKIAFNILAFHFGADTVRNLTFDPIREYIRRSPTSSPSEETQDTEVFVRALEPETVLVPTVATHQVTFSVKPGNGLIGQVVLYKSIVHIVYLGDFEISPTTPFVVYEFDIHNTGKTHVRLDNDEIYRRIQSRRKS